MPITSDSPEMAHSAEEVGAMLDRVARAHFRLVWVAGADAPKRTQVIMAVASHLGCPYVSVGRKLSAVLMEVSPNLRAVSAEEAFSDLVRAERAETLCLDRIEILFDSSLRLNAPSLVKNVSRRYRLVASWPGILRDQSLCFGPSDHPSRTVIPAHDVECPVYPIR